MYSRRRGQLGSKLVHKFSNNKKINVYAVDKFFKYKYSNVSYVDLDVKNDFDNRFEIIPIKYGIYRLYWIATFFFK